MQSLRISLKLHAGKAELNPGPGGVQLRRSLELLHAELTGDDFEDILRLEHRLRDLNATPAQAGEADARTLERGVLRHLCREYDWRAQDPER